MQETIKNINKFTVWLLVFLFPLFFLPISADIFFYPKQTLFFILTTISLFFWLIFNFFFKKKILLRKTPGFYLFLFLFFSGASTFFSLAKGSSFWGFPLDIGEGFSFLFFSLVFVFLLIHTFEQKTEIHFLFLLFLTSAFFLCLFLIFQLYFPTTLFGNYFFNPFGNITTSSIFFALLLPVTLSFFFQARSFWKGFFGVLIFSFVFFIAASGVKIAWFLSALMLIFLLIFSAEKEESSHWRMLTLSILLIVSIFFYFFPKRLVFFPHLPPEFPSLPPAVELSIIRDSFSQGITRLLFGTGPGTFVFAYSKYRPLNLNESKFWGTRFNHGATAILDWLITKGVLFTISFVFFFIFTLALVLKKVLKNREGLSLFDLGVFASTLGTFLAAFFTSFNISLWFIFWFFLASSYFILSKKIEINFTTIPFLRGMFFVIFLVLFSFLFLLTVFQCQKYLANVYYQKSILESEKNLEIAIKKIKKATEFDSNSDIYWRDLAQFLILRANQIAIDESRPLNERRTEINKMIEEGISAIEKAISVSPYNVANWNVRGFIFRNLIGFTGAGEIALASYRKASELEPASPYPFTEMGRVYILIAQDFDKKNQEEQKKEALSLARTMLAKSLEKKRDYVPAHYLMAVALNQEGKEKEAIESLKEAVSLSPNDLAMVFQLSFLYYRNKEFEKAKEILEKTVKEFPNYSNGRYLLGLVYDKMGEKEKAKEQFKAILELNPENSEVKKILENLEKGLEALEGIVEERVPQIRLEEKSTSL